MILAATVTGFASLYIPSISKYHEFYDWKSANPAFKMVADIDLSKLKGVYLPVSGCTRICKADLKCRQ